MERVIDYKIERSEFPEGDKTHLIIMHSASEGQGFGGFCYKRIFKGSYKECKVELDRLNKELEEKKNGN